MNEEESRDKGPRRGPGAAAGEGARPMENESVQVREAKMGGKEILRVIAVGNDDVRNSLFSRADGGRLDRGLRELVQSKHGGAFRLQVRYEPAGRGELPTEFQQRLAEEECDVVVVSVEPAVSGFLDVEHFRAGLVRLVRRVKERSGAHVIVYNCSSVDQEDAIHNYHRREDTFSVRVNRANLALIEVSGLEGISIIDVDRLIATLGGERHVVARLYYSAEACQAVRDEVLRVLEDIGFFETRPLVPQIGRRK